MTDAIPLHALDDVDSTMAEAERLADAGAPGPLVVWARAQTGGVGRHGRHWASPPGNLYWTMLLTEPADRPRDAGLSVAAALALLDALEAVGVPPARLRLKWPNDVMLDGRKLAGVLVQASTIGPRLRLVVGIGVNVAAAPDASAYPATSLAAAGLAADIVALRDALTAAFLARAAQWRSAGLPGLVPSMAARLHGIGQPVRIALDRDRRDVIDGLHGGLDPAGGLVLVLPDGTRRVMVAGDILA